MNARPTARPPRYLTGWSLALGLVLAPSAFAADPEAQLAWDLGFGGAAPIQSPRLVLGSSYRTPGDALPIELFRMELSARGLAARLAGTPLMDRRYRADQAEDAVVEVEADRATGASEGTNWLAWVGGFALAGLAVGTAGSGHGDCGDDCGDSRSNTSGSDVNGANVTGASADVEDGTAHGGCVDGTCAVCTEDGDVDTQCPGGFAPRRASRTEPRDFERQRWLDAGTGHMGDLLAR